MTVTLTDPLDGSAEQLHAVTTGTSITASYANGVLLLSGVADTSTYQAVLRSITYSDTAPSPTLGDRTIDVVVDDGTLGSATAVSTVNVLPTGSAATTTAVTSADSTVVYGQSVTLTATVSPSSGSATPTGTVTFTSGSTTLGTGTLTRRRGHLEHHRALAEGSDTVTASYGGDSTYSPSSGTLTETVNQAATATALTASPNPAVYGQAVTLTATVSASSPGAGTPTGTVSFTGSDGTSLGTETCVQRRGHAHHHRTARGQQHDHGFVQRRQRLHVQQRQRHRDHQPGRHDHRAVRAIRFRGLRPVRHLYGHGERQLRRAPARPPER